jgi:hypothetical protein
MRRSDRLRPASSEERDAARAARGRGGLKGERGVCQAPLEGPAEVKR